MELYKKFKKSICCRILREFLDADMPVYAANSAFFVLLAGMPMFMLALSLINLIPQYSVEGFIDLLQSFLPDVPEISDSVDTAIMSLYEQSTAAVISITALTTLISASSGIYALLKGLRRVDALPENSFLRTRIRAILSTFAFLIAIMLMIATQFLQRPIENAALELSALFMLNNLTETVIHIMHITGVISIVFAFLTILILYTWLPNRHDSIRKNIPGAAFTTLGWYLVTKVFKYYIRYFWTASPIYGSLGAIVLLALWVYIIMNLIFLGAVLNKCIRK